MTQDTTPRNIADYRRQAAMFDPSQHSEMVVAVVGAGNVGSHTLVALARMGLRQLVAYDPDIVEPHNLSSQAYLSMDIGTSKVEAIARHIEVVAPDATLVGHPTKFEEAPAQESGAPYILVSAVDSLEARRAVAERLMQYQPAPLHIIDCRVGGEQIELYVCNSPQEWLGTIPESAQADPCGAQFITYVSMVAGALIAATVKKLLNGEPVHRSMLLHIGTMEIVRNFRW